MVSALDLPRPARPAVIYGLLATAAVSLDADPRLPWLAGAVAAILFASAGTVRTLRARRELAAVRRTADHLIVHTPHGNDASELVRWRCAEITARGSRQALRRDIERTLRSLDPARLPSASPLRRPAARKCAPDLRELSSRLGDERPIAARGVLLARALVRDPASPLYSDDAERLLPGAVRRILGALEP